MEYDLIRSRKDKNGPIHHELHSDTKEKNIKMYSAIRAGLHWPTEESPGYAVFLGQEKPNSKLNPDIEQGPLRLLIEREYQGLRLNDFLGQITDDSALLKADIIYSQPDEALKRVFWDYCDDRNVKGFRLLEAPFFDRFLLGLNRILDLDSSGDLRIDKQSLVYQQLQAISKQDLALEPETKYWRLDALRHVVSGFAKSPPPKQYIFNRNRNVSKTAWMGA